MMGKGDMGRVELRTLSIFAFSRPATMKSATSRSRKAGVTSNAEAMLSMVTLL